MYKYTTSRHVTLSLICWVQKNKSILFKYLHLHQVEVSVGKVMLSESIQFFNLYIQLLNLYYFEDKVVIWNLLSYVGIGIYTSPFQLYISYYIRTQKLIVIVVTGVTMMNTDHWTSHQRPALLELELTIKTSIYN